ncbi:MAG: hypothetical protein GF353_04950, partial [Candidatus Lokiarchaeota archaeon]|nr:hypothetical protein [Candidatus Lokiarchaeota archaeon]
MGYTPIDLESTALSNVKEIIELDATASYSQNRVFYFIYNISEVALKEVLQFRNIRCVVNTADNVSGLVREIEDQSEFIFYNKKNKKFLNYDFTDIDLSLEEELIGDDTHILQDSLIQLKALATKIFLRINESKSFHDLLSFSSYKMEHWNRILEFVRNYYSIRIPEL